MSETEIAGQSLVHLKRIYNQARCSGTYLKSQIIGLQLFEAILEYIERPYLETKSCLPGIPIPQIKFI